MPYTDGMRNVDRGIRDIDIVDAFIRPQAVHEPAKALLAIGLGVLILCYAIPAFIIYSPWMIKHMREFDNSRPTTPGAPN